MPSGRTLCACTSGRTYGKCCKPFHRMQALPEPEQLMRSRYCAFALGKAAYLVETATEPPPLEQLKAAYAGMKFTRLTILEVVPPVADVAYVTFRAGIEHTDGRDLSFTERSRFVRTDRWRYADGQPIPGEG